MVLVLCLLFFIHCFAPIWQVHYGEKMSFFKRFCLLGAEADNHFVGRKKILDAKTSKVCFRSEFPSLG